MTDQIKVAILDKQQSSIFGFIYCLQTIENIKVVATSNYAEEIEFIFANQVIDVLLFDLNVPITLK